jgi:hypothetical protein
MRNVVFAAISLCALAGCDMVPIDPPVMAVAPTTYHDVAYYDANPLARNQANAWCHDNPGLAAKVPSCESADESSIHAWNSKMGLK